MKSAFLALTSALLPFLLTAQSISPIVGTNAGDYGTSTNAALSWTFGELMIDSYSGSSSMLTQGFQQPDYIITALPPEAEQTSFEPNIYPNPVTDEVNITWDPSTLEHSKGPIAFVLFDMSGKQITTKRAELQSGRAGIDFSSITSGKYFLRIQQKETPIAKAYHITKVR